MIIEAKIFLTCALLILMTLVFVGAVKGKSVPDSVKIITSAIFLLSVTGVMASLFMLIWR